MTDLFLARFADGRFDDLARWAAIIAAFVFAAPEVADGSVGAIAALAIAVAYGVYSTMRGNDVVVIEDVAFLLAINGAAITSPAWFAFVPLLVVSLIAIVVRDFLGGERRAPARQVEPAAEPLSGIVVDELPRLVAANERRRAVRAADRAGEWLTFAFVGLDKLAGLDPRLAELSDDLEAAVDELRIRVELVLDGSDDLTFAERLHELTEGARELHGWDAEIEIAADEDAEAPAAPLIRQALLDIAAEALDNAGRHASAATVSVRWSADGDARTLAVVDDGFGFDVDQQHGAGLDAMARTARAIGAAFDITSVPDRGTSVMVMIPGSRLRGAATTAGGGARS